jgi:hypothetical protein
MNTAKLVERKPADFRGNAAVYQLSPPVDDGEGGKTEFVVVSGVRDTWVHEVMVFPCNNAAGEGCTFLDLACIRKSLSHEAALDHLGYKIV